MPTDGKVYLLNYNSLSLSLFLSLSCSLSLSLSRARACACIFGERFKEKYLHEVNRLINPALGKVWLCELTAST